MTAGHLANYHFRRGLALAMCAASAALLMLAVILFNSMQADAVDALTRPGPGRRAPSQTPGGMTGQTPTPDQEKAGPLGD